MPPRVARFAGWNERHFETGEGEHEQQHNRGKFIERWRFGERVTLWFDKECANTDEHEQGYELSDGKHVARRRRSAYAENIYKHIRADYCDDGHDPPDPGCRRRIKITEIADQQIAQRGKTRQPREPHQPADLKSG